MLQETTKNSRQFGYGNVIDGLDKANYVPAFIRLERFNIPYNPRGSVVAQQIGPADAEARHRQAPSAEDLLIKQWSIFRLSCAFRQVEQGIPAAYDSG